MNSHAEASPAKYIYLLTPIEDKYVCKVEISSLKPSERRQLLADEMVNGMAIEIFDFFVVEQCELLFAKVQSTLAYSQVMPVEGWYSADARRARNTIMRLITEVDLDIAPLAQKSGTSFNRSCIKESISPARVHGRHTPIGILLGLLMSALSVAFAVS